jgi:hypothetical protein
MVLEYSPRLCLLPCLILDYSLLKEGAEGLRHHSLLKEAHEQKTHNQEDHKHWNVCRTIDHSIFYSAASIQNGNSDEENYRCGRCCHNVSLTDCHGLYDTTAIDPE